MPESLNGASAELPLHDWLATPDAGADPPATPAPAHPLPQPHPGSPHPRRPAVADAALIVPDVVRLQLDTALCGDSAPHGSPGPDGRPRSKNLTVLVGTVRVRTQRSGQAQRVITDLGAVQYCYELSINEVCASATGVAYACYRFPITMPDAVLARCRDLLVDGQRVAVLGPLALEVTYDSRFQTHPTDAGRRTWTVQLDVLDVRAVGDEVPDMAWVQLEGEVLDRPRLFAHRYGDRRTMIDHYAGVNLRCRELLAGPRGAAARAVTRVVPIEVLIDPHEEVIVSSDALLRPGNRVRIEGRLNPATYRIRAAEDAPHSDAVAQALERTRASLVARNAALHVEVERHQQAVQTIQERNRVRAAAGKAALPLPPAPARPLSDYALEQRICHAQRRLLTGTRIRVEVGAVELLAGTPLSAAERAQLIAEQAAAERTRPAGRHQPPVRPAQAPPAAAARAAVLDQATAELLLPEAEAASAAVAPPVVRPPLRPRRRVMATSPGAAGAAPPDETSEAA